MKFDLHYLLSAKHAQWISIALIALFSILIIGEFFSLQFTSVNVSTMPEKEIPKAVKQGSFKSILHSSLFGVYVTNDLSDTSVKKSMLNVTVMGILFADRAEDSQVIIRIASGEEKTFKVGDNIPGDAIIKRITADGVLVERQGVLESLSLPKNELTFEPAPKPLKEE